jgi:hypothetical protein
MSILASDWLTLIESLSWGLKSSLLVKKIPLFIEPKGWWRFRKTPLLVPILSQRNPTSPYPVAIPTELSYPVRIAGIQAVLLQYRAYHTWGISSSWLFCKHEVSLLNKFQEDKMYPGEDICKLNMVLHLDLLWETPQSRRPVCSFV